ncbi:DUF4291 domain-containing protein [Bradyrhizobium sp. JR3.5]
MGIAALHPSYAAALAAPELPYAASGRKLRVMNDIPQHQIRAVYDEHTIRIYQAYNNEIADAALAAGTFVSPPFSMTRMTWIKPSFLWMMYRAGWGYKDAGQSRILAIDITREGLEWALANSCPSHPDPATSKDDWEKLKANSPVRIQWDPERDLHLQPLPHRAIQIGIGGEAVQLYVGQWIRKITDVTELAHTIHDLVERGRLDQAQAALPIERVYLHAG